MSRPTPTEIIAARIDASGIALPLSITANHPVFRSIIEDLADEGYRIVHADDAEMPGLPSESPATPLTGVPAPSERPHDPFDDGTTIYSEPLSAAAVDREGLWGEPLFDRVPGRVLGFRSLGTLEDYTRRHHPEAWLLALPAPLPGTHESDLILAGKIDLHSGFWHTNPVPSWPSEFNRARAWSRLASTPTHKEPRDA